MCSWFCGAYQQIGEKNNPKLTFFQEEWVFSVHGLNSDPLATVFSANFDSSDELPKSVAPTENRKRRQPKHPQKKNTPHLSLSLFPRGEQRVCARARKENSSSSFKKKKWHHRREV